MSTLPVNKTSRALPPEVEAQGPRLRKALAKKAQEMQPYLRTLQETPHLPVPWKAKVVLLSMATTDYRLTHPTTAFRAFTARPRRGRRAAFNAHTLAGLQVKGEDEVSPRDYPLGSHNPLEKLLNASGPTLYEGGFWIYLREDYYVRLRKEESPEGPLLQEYIPLRGFRQGLLASTHKDASTTYSLKEYPEEVLPKAPLYTCTLPLEEDPLPHLAPHLITEEKDRMEEVVAEAWRLGKSKELPALIEAEYHRHEALLHHLHLFHKRLRHLVTLEAPAFLQEYHRLQKAHGLEEA